VSRLVRAVFFDVDDTIVDYAATARLALDEAMGAAGNYDLWQEISEPYFRRYDRGEIEFAAMRIERTAHFLRELGREDDSRRAADLETARFVCLNRSFVLFDDVLPCLAALRERSLRLGVITNNDGPHQRRKLAAVGLADSFDALAISGELGSAKPDPAIFQHACTAIGVAADAALHVGDRLDTDALGAVGAGLIGVWLDRRRAAGGERRVPVVSTLAELPALVERAA
jgi:putative hydrolase of the HAD superfamily